MQRPEPSSRHPLVVFLLILTMLSGITIVIGGPSPGSIGAALPPWGVLLWALALSGGSALILIGLGLQPFDKHLVVGVLFEQVGVAMLGPAAIVYSAAALAAVGWTGAFPAGLTFGFGVSCLYRWFTLQRGINRARTAAEGEHTDGQA